MIKFKPSIAFNTSKHKLYKGFFVLVMCVGVSGCGTIDVPLGSMFGGNTAVAKNEPQKFEPLQKIEIETVDSSKLDDLTSDVTGSLPSVSKLAAVEFSQSDWNAIEPSLHAQLNTPTPSAPPTVWLNAQTGAFGALHVPTRANAGNVGASPCQPFYVSLAHGAGQNWMRGTACKTGANAGWQTQDLKPSAAPN